MSIEAITWALNHAPIPTDRKNASSLAIVLLGLANHADPDGCNAFPAISTLVRYTRLSARAVQYSLRALEELGLITPADPKIVTTHVQRKDRRPNIWNLAIHTTHTVVHTSIHNPDSEMHTLHPAAPDEVHTRPHGVHTTTSRGAQNAPETSFNHPGNLAARRRTSRPAQPDPVPGAPPPICEQCDARPGDPVSARVVWLDEAHHNSRLCPRCHPAALATARAEEGDR